MKVTIGIYGETPLDVTDRLLDPHGTEGITGTETELTQELERDIFERVVGDVELQLTNMDGSLRDMFLSKPNSTYWDVKIGSDEGRKLFRGRLQQPINFNVDSEILTVRVLSIDKVFWEYAGRKYLELRTERELSEIYWTLGDVLATELESILTSLNIGLQIHADFIDRPVRSTFYSYNPNDGNQQSFSVLAGDTTVKELLTAAGIYYNAEFFIDPETERFTMHPRGVVLNDTNVNLDDIMLDNDIEFDSSDEKKYDYVHVSFTFPRPLRPRMVRLELLLDADVALGYGLDYRLDFTRVIYQIVNVLNINGIEADSEPSNLSSCEVVGFNLGGALGVYVGVVLFVPCGPTGTVRRKMYRSVYGGSYFYVGAVEGNNTTAYRDGVAGSDVVEKMSVPTANQAESLFPQKPISDVYVTYDEITGVAEVIMPRETPLVIAPEATIFEVTPVLRFTESDGSQRDFATYDAYVFFGREQNPGGLIKQWLPMLTTRRRIKCSVTGTNYRFGDSFYSKKEIFPNDYTPDRRMVAKYVKNQLMSDRSVLQLITL